MTPIRLPCAGACHILLRMWQVLSQEKPARPRLALIVVSLALGGSLGLAWWACLRPAVPTVERDQRPTDWPIRFQLPDYVVWTQRGIDDPVRAADDGTIGAIDFLGLETGLRSYRLRVMYQAIQSESAENELVSLLSESAPDDSEPIDVGPLKGRLYVTQIGQSADLFVYAWTPDGISFEIQLSAMPYDLHAREILRDICRSIEYQDSWMPKPRI